MNRIQETLEKIGIKEIEVKTYLALLDLGEATTTKIAERTDLGRVHMYQITNKLIEKGLASFIIKNNVKYFSAADPETILKELEENQRNFKKILPELKKRQKLIALDTKVEIYRGVEGINTILKIILRDKKNYVMLGGGEQFSKADIKTITNIFLKQAEKLKIEGKLLDRKEAHFVVAKHEKYHFIQKEYLTSTTSVVWGKKYAIFVWTSPYYVILVENKEIAESNLALFNYLWKISEEPSKGDIKKRLIKIHSNN